jgi:hypothetical protein
MWVRALTVSTLVATFFLACGGRTDGVGSSSSSSGASSGGSGSGSGSGSSSGSTSSGSSSGSTSCVFVDLSTYDRSCNTASDCVYVTGGDICNGSCPWSCGSDLINASQLGRYESAVASIQVNDNCECGVAAPPQCIDHLCTYGVDVVDAGPADAGLCVDVDLSTYDQSCKGDSDCVEISAGLLCSGNCACGGSTINVDGQARYDQEIAPIDFGLCPCPAEGVPRCVTGKCTLCGSLGQNQPPGCPDGG